MDSSTSTQLSVMSSPLLEEDSEDSEPFSSNIEPKFMFGLITGVSSNCLYLNDHVIVYPAAGVIVVYDLEAHSQKFIRLNEPRRIITAMDLNLINHVLAVATIAENDDYVNKADNYAKPTISIYDLKSLSLKQVFVEPDEEWKTLGPRRFTKIRYLYDNVYMVALLVIDGSECVLYFYSWRNSTVDMYVRIDGLVTDMALNPIDLSICCFVGKELFQFMTKTETDWSQYGFREAEGIDFTCVCWLSSDRCLAGTMDGRVMIFKNGVFQSVHYMDMIHDIDVTAKMKSESLSITSDVEIKSTSASVRGCIAFESGLIFVAGESSIYHFQKTDNGERYVRNNVYVKQNNRYLEMLVAEGELPLHYVESACISPNGKILTCVTRNGQLNSSPLHYRKLNTNHDEDDLFDLIIEIQPLYEELHYGGVGSLSTSLWRPILITGGKIDFTVKLWNYTNGTLLLSKHYYHQVLSVSIHPTALYSVVAFADHVEFQIIRVNDLVPLKNFQIRDCNLTVFSGAGHMFALAKPSGEIEVYSTIKFEKCFSCSIRLNPIERLVWSYLDKSIVVYDTTGAMCAFHSVDGRVLMHTLAYSEVTFTDLAVNDNNNIFVTAEDGILREVYDSKVVREINLYQGPLNAISFSKSNKILFVATQSGVVLTITVPIMLTVTYTDFKVHNHSISKICLAMDGSVLISCSEDGSMCIWEVEDVVNKKNNIDDRFEYSDDLLIKWSEYEKISKDVNNCKTSVDVFEANSKHYINSLKNFKEQELDRLQKEFVIELDETRRNNNVEEKIRNDDISKLKNEVAALEETNILSMEILDTKYARRLLYKYNKYSDLENKTAAIISKQKKSIDELKQKLRDELQETITDYAEKLKEKQVEMFKSRELLINKKNNLRMLADETENDIDKCILDKKNAYIIKLKKMKELNRKTTDELTQDKIHYNLCLDSNSELKRLIDNVEKDLNELKDLTIEKTKKNYILKRMLQNNTETIQKKDIELKEVYQKAFGLEKEIDLKNEIIADLAKESRSLTSEIQNTKKLIEQVDIKYNNIKFKKKKRMELYLTKLEQAKIDVESEYKEQKNLIHNTNNRINQIEVDLRLASQHYKNSSDNKAAVIAFFNKYMGENTKDIIENGDIEAREELYRQMNITECSIAKLKNDVQLSDKNSYLAIMEKNMKLMAKMAGLREESHKCLTKYNYLKDMYCKE